MGGAFFAAIRAQVDVVPMAVIGTYEMLKMNTWHIKPRPLRVLVGEPIPTTGMSVRDTESLAAKARATIARLYDSHSPLPELQQNLKSQESNQ
jgi:1-acyl-sn-glycerol-3-phosphate acyltransferase